MSPRRRWAVRTLLVVPTIPLACLIGSYVAARVFVRSNGGNDAGDIPPFVFYTIPFSVALIVLSFGLLILLPNVRLALRIIVGLIVGASAGFLWTIINRWMLGMWFGAWGFPVLYCWIVGGVLGMLTGTIVELLLLRIYPIEKGPDETLNLNPTR